MKKVITMLMLCLFAAVTAQDGYNQTDSRYQEVKNSITELTAIEARQLSDTFAEGYSYTTTTGRDRSFSIVYSLASVERWRGIDLVVSFRHNGHGYNLVQVDGAPERMRLIWRKHFLPTATDQNIDINYKYSDLIHKDKKLYIRLLGNKIKRFKK